MAKRNENKGTLITDPEALKSIIPSVKQRLAMSRQVAQAKAAFASKLTENPARKR